MRNIIQDRPYKVLYGSAVARIDFIGPKDLYNKTVLDIGCGYGWFEYQAMDKSVKKIYAMEVTDNDLITAKNNIKDKRVKYLVGSGNNIPLDDDTCDTVVCWEVIEHIPENSEIKMFAEINRVLKPNGVLYLSTPYNSFFSNIFDPAWWIIGHRHYSAIKLMRFASLNKFNVSDILVKGGFWSIIYNINMYFSKWILRRQPIRKKFFQSKSTKEYKKNSGFLTVFIKFIKSD